MPQPLGQDGGIATLDASLLGTGPITTDILRSIFASDQDMYPAPLTFERLQSWVNAAPEASCCFYADEDQDQGDDRAAAATKVLVGAVVAMPLREARWEALLNGALKETDVQAAEDFSNDNGGDSGIGVHVFHVEKFQGPRVAGFARAAVDAVVQSVMAAGRGRVIGVSALTATEDGKRTFARLGLAPTGYEEVWVRGEAGAAGQVAGQARLVCVTPKTRNVDEALAVMIGSAEVLGRAQMMVSRRG